MFLEARFKIPPRVRNVISEATKDLPTTLEDALRLIREFEGAPPKGQSAQGDFFWITRTFFNPVFQGETWMQPDPKDLNRFNGLLRDIGPTYQFVRGRRS